MSAGRTAQNSIFEWAFSSSSITAMLSACGGSRHFSVLRSRRLGRSRAAGPSPSWLVDALRRHYNKLEGRRPSGRDGHDPRHRGRRTISRAGRHALEGQVVAENRHDGVGAVDQGREGAVVHREVSFRHNHHI